MNLLELLAVMEFARSQAPDVLSDERLLGSLAARRAELPKARKCVGVEVVNLVFDITFPCCRTVVLQEGMQIRSHNVCAIVRYPG